MEEKSLAAREDRRQDVELGTGVEGGVGEDELDGAREANVGTGEGDGLRVEGEELKEW